MGGGVYGCILAIFAGSTIAATSRVDSSTQEIRIPR
jgi:hypothetical protein